MMKATMVWSSVIGPKSGSARQYSHARELSRACVGFHYLGELVRLPCGERCERIGDDPGDAGERKPAGKEGFHRDLVGRVEHRGRCAAGAQGGIGERKARKACGIR